MIKIQKVKYRAKEENPTENSGFTVNGNIFVPNDKSNRDYIAVQKWIKQGNTPEPAHTIAEINDIGKANSLRDSTNLISRTIQNEINAYNAKNGISLGSIHIAESYSRIPGYSHQAFCKSVWNWSVDLWEFMRAWQNTLSVYPTKEEIIAKIAEKPFKSV